MVKIIFPSTTAAILVGSIWMPAFIIIAKFIESKTSSSILLLIWGFIGFALPLIVSTSELSYICRNFFKVKKTREDFRIFYFPAWKRIGILFLSTCVSVAILKLLGITIG